MNQRVLAGLMSAMLVACVMFAEERNAPMHPHHVGGLSSYDKYSGLATITRIQKTAASRAQVATARYEGYEIWFKFTPDVPIRQDWAAKKVGEEHLLQLMNSWYPGEKYIQKYGIAVGKQYRCTMNVLTSGTGTPIFFEFEGLDRCDYFESASVP
ncbi:MAG: hypothetical protein N2255_02420 [Kiritimatiellae bacterium]|nr:hypothetical protein [Kiritimatiellia bacterium]